MNSKKDFLPHHKEDLTKIIDTIKLETNVLITMEEANTIWTMFSTSKNVNWEVLPKTNNELWDILSNLPYIGNYIGWTSIDLQYGN